MSNRVFGGGVDICQIPDLVAVVRCNHYGLNYVCLMCPIPYAHRYNTGKGVAEHLRHYHNRSVVGLKPDDIKNEKLHGVTHRQWKNTDQWEKDYGYKVNKLYKVEDAKREKSKLKLKSAVGKRSVKKSSVNAGDTVVAADDFSKDSAVDSRKRAGECSSDLRVVIKKTRLAGDGFTQESTACEGSEHLTPPLVQGLAFPAAPSDGQQEKSVGAGYVETLGLLPISPIPDRTPYCDAHLSSGTDFSLLGDLGERARRISGSAAGRLADSSARQSSDAGDMGGQRQPAIRVDADRLTGNLIEPQQGEPVDGGQRYSEVSDVLVEAQGSGPSESVDVDVEGGSAKSRNVESGGPGVYPFQHPECFELSHGIYIRGPLMLPGAGVIQGPDETGSSKGLVEVQGTCRAIGPFPLGISHAVLDDFREKKTTWEFVWSVHRQVVDAATNLLTKGDITEEGVIANLLAFNPHLRPAMVAPIVRDVIWAMQFGHMIGMRAKR